MLLLGIITLLVILITYYVIKIHTYWRRRNVPEFDLWSNIKITCNFLLGSDSFHDIYIKLYKRTKHHRCFGIYQLGSPFLLIQDPEVIKNIAVKDFEHFPNHRTMASTNDPLWGKNLFASKGERWRALRATMSPTFTTSKMRLMFTLMNESAQKYVDHYKSGPGQFSLELKNSFTKLSNDVIASCAFGIQVDSLKEPENEFYLMGKLATNWTSVLRSIKIFIGMSNPTLTKLLKIDFFPKKVRDFFEDIINRTIEYREKENIIRPDLIHLLMEARKGRLTYEEDTESKSKDNSFAIIDASQIDRNEKLRLTNLSNQDITAQGMLFFVAGFDSTSTALSFLVYELAVNPEIQERLRNEIIEEVVQKNHGEITYDVVTKMKYLDMVVSEGLRKWPLSFLIDRLCAKDYIIPKVKEDEEDIVLKAGDSILINTIGIHRDPEIYPNPDVFNPERFSEENRQSLTPYNYLPFGVGPRHCIAIRFALMEVKTVLTHLLLNFDLYPTEKTQIPLKLAKRMTMAPENGIWLGMKIRKN